MSDLPDGWGEEPYDPERDEAPEGDPDHDCDGDDAPDDKRTIRGGEGTPEDRGWGPGWPHCQASKIVVLVRSDGLRIGVRREISPLTALLMDETERLGYDLKPGSTWGFACRPIRGSSRPSNHSWGLADDLNADDNPMGGTHGAIRAHPEVIALWKSYGYRWGGDYSGRKDDMHFEFMGTPAELEAYTARARQELGMPTLKEILDGIEDRMENGDGPLHQLWAGELERRGGKLLEATDIIEKIVRNEAKASGRTYDPGGDPA